MILCSEGHEEVCYEGRTCPACDAIKEAVMYQEDSEEKAKFIAELEKELFEVKANVEQSQI